jgi:HSF-type DNA-binding
MMLIMLHIDKLHESVGQSGSTGSQAISIPPIDWCTRNLGKDSDHVIVIQDIEEFVRNVLPEFGFETISTRSFVRKMYRWGFRQVSGVYSGLYKKNSKQPHTPYMYESKHFRKNEFSLLDRMQSTTAEKGSKAEKALFSKAERCKLDHMHSAPAEEDSKSGGVNVETKTQSSTVAERTKESEKRPMLDSPQTMQPKRARILVGDKVLSPVNSGGVPLLHGNLLQSGNVLNNLSPDGGCQALRSLPLRYTTMQNLQPNIHILQQPLPLRYSVMQNMQPNVHILQQTKISPRMTLGAADVLAWDNFSPVSPTNFHIQLMNEHPLVSYMRNQQQDLFGGRQGCLTLNESYGGKVMPMGFATVGQGPINRLHPHSGLHQRISAAGTYLHPSTSAFLNNLAGVSKLFGPQHVPPFSQPESRFHQALLDMRSSG